MAMLVTLEQAKAHLRVDTDAGDGDLELKIKAASRAVLRYLKNGADPFTDSAGEPYEDTDGVALNIPEDVQDATLMMLGYLDRTRDSDPEKAFEMGCLPRPVMALLYPLRDPALR